MTPDQYTIKESFLEVGDGHRLYVQDWGNPDSKLPILVLHGGPGNGCDDSDKKKFDPLTQRVIFHDQRGAGKSLPAGALQHNTTQDLVEDIKKLAGHLQLDRFVLVGGSWGATLALAYGIRYPDSVAAMVLNGVYTNTAAEIGWLEQGGWRKFFPEIWEKYTDSVPSDYQADPTAYHLKQAVSDDPEAVKKSAYAFQAMEVAILKLDDIYTLEPFETYDPTNACLEMHYTANTFFLGEDELLTGAARLTMPIWLLQGRYDMVCPPAAAYRLDKALPNSQLIWTINGHLRQHEASNIQRLLLRQLTEAG